MPQRVKDIPFSSIRKEIRKGVRSSPEGSFQKEFALVDFMPCDLRIWVGKDSDFFRRAFCHHRMILKILLSGSASTNIDGIRYKLSPSDAVLYFPMQSHSTETQSGKDFEYFAISFVAGLGRYEALDVLKNRVLSFDEEGKRILSELVTAWQESRQVHCTCLLTELLSCLADRCSGEKEKVSGRFGRIAKYIRENCSKDLSVKQIASEFEVSTQSVRRLFRKNIQGLTPGSLIRKQRMILAEELLRRTTLSLQEIAMQCRFSTVFSFSRAFRREYGLAPSLYRREKIVPQEQPGTEK